MQIANGEALFLESLDLSGIKETEMELYNIYNVHFNIFFQYSVFIKNIRFSFIEIKIINNNFQFYESINYNFNNK